MESDRLRQKAEAEKAELRSQLLRQFNLVLETRDTARGLIDNMSDVLFDTGKYSLRSGAREKLAKVGGIILGHPGLRLDVEGHTDNVGGDEYNQRLSEDRGSERPNRWSRTTRPRDGGRTAAWKWWSPAKSSGDRLVPPTAPSELSHTLNGEALRG